MVRRFKTKTKKTFNLHLAYFFAGTFLFSVVLMAVSVYAFPNVGLLLRPAADRLDMDSGMNGNPFKDVPETYAYVSSVNYLKAKGIIKGYPDGSFKPGDHLTRAEMSKILVSVHDAMPHNLVNSYCFDDVNREWFAPYVCFSKTKGWVQGYADGKFYPEKNLSKDEAGKMISKSLGVVTDHEPALQNLIAGQNSAENITRGETCELLAKTIALARIL